MAGHSAGSTNKNTGPTLSWTPRRPDFTTAEMVEEVRELVVAAWERGESPEYLEVSPEIQSILTQMKLREIRRGVPIVLVGLVVQ